MLNLKGARKRNSSMVEMGIEDLVFWELRGTDDPKSHHFR